MKHFYFEIYYFDDKERPMFSFLLLSFSTENVCNVLCQVPYKDVLHHLFRKHLLLFYLNKQIAALQTSLSQ